MWTVYFILNLLPGLFKLFVYCVALSDSKVAIKWFFLHDINAKGNIKELINFDEINIMIDIVQFQIYLIKTLFLLEIWKESRHTKWKYNASYLESNLA